MFFVTIFDAYTTILTNVRILYAGVNLSTFFSAHSFVALTLERPPGVNARPSATAVDPQLIALVDVHLAVLPLEARTGAVALVVVDEIDAPSAVEAGHRFTLVDFDFAQSSGVAGYAATHRNIVVVSHANRTVLTLLHLTEWNIA